MRAGLWLLLGLLLAPLSGHADPSALWNIVNGKCVPNEKTMRDPAPCELVELSDGIDKGYVLLKDIHGVAQFLLIPTARISGIEDPAILAPDAFNYWNAAWHAHYFVEERLQTELPRDAISLAINSAFGRSQNQLHIHVDCIRPDVRQALAAHQNQVTKVWTRFPVPLAGHTYRAIRIDHESLGDVDPFHILSDADPVAANDMGKQTLVLVGANFNDGTHGFILLNDHVDLLDADRASGEDLQDHTCAIVPK
jgi:CDP-diacylglycerol pyrophosphatase